GGAHRDVGEDRGDEVSAKTHPEEQQVGRGLPHAQADHKVDQMSAGDDAVEADQEDPDGDRVGSDAHLPDLRRTISSWSRNSESKRRKPPATSKPTAKLSNGIVPAETSEPGVRTGRKFSRKAPAKMIPPAPISTKAAAPPPSETSTRLRGRTRRRATDPPPR